MTLSPTTMRVLQRARTRYPQLHPTLLEKLATTAVSSVAKRGFPDRRTELVAAHVTLARLAGSHTVRLERDALLATGPVLHSADPADMALAEHLHGRLEQEELLVAALRARSVPPHRAAVALNLQRDELAKLEASGDHKAAELTLAYHDELICEPAALSGADSPATRAAAVREHLASCRSCRLEFRQRARLVLELAGTLVTPLPPLHEPGQGPRLALVSGLRRR